MVTVMMMVLEQRDAVELGHKPTCISSNIEPMDYIKWSPTILTQLKMEPAMLLKMAIIKVWVIKESKISSYLLWIVPLITLSY